MRVAESSVKRMEASLPVEEQIDVDRTTPFGPVEEL